MYFVNKQSFEDILDAIDCCKASPPNKILDDKGIVIMEHVPLSFDTFKDIMVAKQVLEIQNYISTIER